MLLPPDEIGALHCNDKPVLVWLPDTIDILDTILGTWAIITCKAGLSGPKFIKNYLLESGFNAVKIKL